MQKNETTHRDLGRPCWPTHIALCPTLLASTVCLDPDGSSRSSASIPTVWPLRWLAGLPRSRWVVSLHHLQLTSLVSTRLRLRGYRPSNNMILRWSNHCLAPGIHPSVPAAFFAVLEQMVHQAHAVGWQALSALPLEGIVFDTVEVLRGDCLLRFNAHW